MPDVRPIQEILVEHAEKIRKMAQEAVPVVLEYFRQAGIDPASLDYDWMVHCGAPSINYPSIEVRVWPRGYEARPGYFTGVRVYFRAVIGWKLDFKDAMTALEILMDSTRWRQVDEKEETQKEDFGRCGTEWRGCK